MSFVIDRIVGYRHGCAVRLLSVDDDIRDYCIQYKGKLHYCKTYEEAKAYIKERFNLEME